MMAQCRPAQSEVRVCHAEPLSPFFQEAALVFERNHLAARVQLIQSGDLEVVSRALTQGDCDLAAVTDWTLIRRFLLSGPASEGFRFLGDEVVLAARPGFMASQQDRQSWSAQWPQRLLAGQGRFGLANPNRHAIGYQTHFVCKLSETHLGHPGLYRSFLKHLEGLPSERIADPSELVDKLKAGAIDFTFLYRSTAANSGLDQIRLPAEVSLAEDRMQDLYARVFFSVAGPPPLGRFEVGGTPVRHGLVMLDQSNEWAGRLLDFLLGPECGEIARGQGYTVIPVQRFTARDQ